VGLIRSRIDHRDLRAIEIYMAKHSLFALITSPWGGLAFFCAPFKCFLVRPGTRSN